MPSILPSFFTVTSLCFFVFGSASHCTDVDEFSFIQKFALAEGRAQQPAIEERIDEQVKKIEHEMGGHSLSLVTLMTVHEITVGQMRKLWALGNMLDTATDEGLADLNSVSPRAKLRVFEQVADQALSKYTAALDPVVEHVHIIYNTTVPALKKVGCPVISLQMGNNLSQALISVDRLNQTASEVEQIVKSLDTVARPLVDSRINAVETKLQNMEGLMKGTFTINVKRAFDAYMNGLLAHVEVLAEEDKKNAMLEKIQDFGPLLNSTIPKLVGAESKLASGFSQAINARRPSQLVKNRHQRQHRKHRRT